MEPVNPPVPVKDVSPHAGRMVLLRNVVAHGPASTLCDVLIRSDDLFFSGGGIPSWVGLEYIAQAVAAHSGMVARASGKPSGVGFLIGARQAEFKVPLFAEGRVLHVLAEHVWGEEETFSFRGEVRDAATGEVLATAQLNLFKPNDLNVFLKGREAS